MTANELLAITRPERLFPGDPAEARKRYRELTKQWHPDLPTGKHEVFAHVTQLYREAQDKLKEGRWDGASVVSFMNKSGASWTRTTRSGAAFPHGHSLICDESVIYLVDFESATEPTLISNFHTVKSRFTYASNRMQEEFERYLPNVADSTWLRDGRYYVEVKKTSGLLRLRDVVTHSGPLDPRHVAWIVSTLLNLTCYLSYAGIVHGDISPDTYFISPSHHSGALLGGWWYTTNRGDSLTVIPRRTFDVLPFKARMTKTASASIDLELVRLTAREIAAPMPEPMKTWLDNPGSGSATDQYSEWLKVLEKTFGKRRFTPMLLDDDTVYGPAVARA